MRWWAALGLILTVSHPAWGSAPAVFHTRNYQAPVSAGPGQLLVIGGSGFAAGDRVVYQLTTQAERPARIPSESVRESGTAQVVRIADLSQSITVRMPAVLAAGEEYRLWVVSAAGEWSAPITVNDPRPIWFSPAHVHATTDLAGLARRLRIVGRNLQPAGSESRLHVRLAGPRSYSFDTEPDCDDQETREFVAESKLPPAIVPGEYTVSVSRSGDRWVDVPDRKLTVRPDGAQPRRFSIDAPELGSCHPDDGRDDSPCINAAITAAREAGGGVVRVPAGTWDIAPAQPTGEALFVVPRAVRLEGVDSTLLRHEDPRDRGRRPWFLLEGSTRVTGLKFVDERQFRAFDSTRAVIQLGHYGSGDVVRDVTITGNTFRHVGLAIADAGIPIEELVVTHNELGGFTHGLDLVGSNNSRARLFRLEDSVIRHNRFVPGSYLDLSVSQGVIASEIGASRRVDVSRNEVDGTSAQELQDAHDQPGFRAAFFWELHDSAEMLLIDRNRIACPGDKAGDGEAIALDDNGDTLGYDRPTAVGAADLHSVHVEGPLDAPPSQWTGGADSYFVGHWIVIVDGPGMGQARKIQRYRTHGTTTDFEVAPDWDVAPVARTSRLIVTRQYWQTYIVGNEIIQSQPTCRKSNLTGPKGGEINIWSTSADSLVAGNRQADTSGIGFKLKHSVPGPACPRCEVSFAAQLALEVRHNQIHGEYDWTSDCSLSGIHATFAASPTPDAPPTTMSYAVAVTDNRVDHADGLRGGAIEIVSTWYAGPASLRRPLIENLIISHNELTEIEGPAPARANCHYGQSSRAAIRIEGGRMVVGTILDANVFERVSTPITDGGSKTLRLGDSP
jgi:hypothetical protein